MDYISLETRENDRPIPDEKHIPHYHKLDTTINGNINMDNIFSYWIYLWFVAYMLVRASSLHTPLNQGFITYWNPLIALLFALVENLIMFIHLIYIWPNTTIIVKYIVMMLLVKIWPIYVLRNSNIRWENDLIHLFYVFIAYNFYLALKGTNIIQVYNETYNSIANNRNQTPLFYTINKFALWFSQKTGYTIPERVRQILGVEF